LKRISLYILPLVFLFTLFSCEINSSTIEKKETRVVLDTTYVESSCNPKEISGYLGEISEENIGVVFIGQPIPDLSNQYEYESQVVDQIVPLSDGTTKTQPITHLYINGNEVLYIEESEEKYVNVLVTYNKYYYLDNCIHVGSSFSEVLNEYDLLNIIINFDDGMMYVRPVDTPTISFMMTIDNVLDYDKIKEIDGSTSIENVNPNGLITSVMVSK